MYRKRLGAFFAYLIKHGWLRVDPLTEVKIMKVMRQERQRPSRAELLSLLDASSNPRDRAWLATLLNTGLRRNEVVRLRVADVDLDQGSLFVTVSKTAEQDLMPITSDLDTELRRWLTHYARTIPGPLLPSYFLFPARRGPRYVWAKDGEGNSIKSIQPEVWRPTEQVKKSEEIVKRALRQVGLPTEHEGAHTIRRAVARILFDDLSNQGHDAALRQVAAWLHHSSLSTTEMYLGVQADRVKRDLALRGRPFLTASIEDDNVVPLRSLQE